MKPWTTAFQLLTSPLTGRPGMSNLERFSAAALKLLFLGGLASWTVMGLYFYKFAPGSWFELSDSDQRWNNFGTFVGGMLGPFFGFLAFIGVIFTVVLQAQQIDTMRKHADLEEIQRVLANLSNRIDTWLQQPPRGAANRFRLLGSPQTLYDLLMLASRVALARAGVGPGLTNYAVDDATWDGLIDDCQRELHQLQVDLDSLAWCMNKYVAQQGSRSVREFYEYRYKLLVAWLLALGAPISPNMHSLFCPTEGLKSIIKGMRGDESVAASVQQG